VEKTQQCKTALQYKQVKKQQCKTKQKIKLPFTFTEVHLKNNFSFHKGRLQRGERGFG